MRPCRLPVAVLLLALPLARAGQPPSGIAEVRPSGREVPANLLRFSIEFAAPLEGPVLPRIGLVHANGLPLRQPFLQQELWSPDNRILTVLLNPGRVKNGLVAREELGPILRATLAARVPELGQLDRRQIASLIGLAPYNRDSGRWRGQRCIGGGRADVRRVLYMATWAAIRARSPLASTYQRLVAAGKPKKLAVTACMRKYLTMLNAMARDQAPWAPATSTA